MKRLLIWTLMLACGMSLQAQREKLLGDLVPLENSDLEVVYEFTRIDHKRKRIENFQTILQVGNKYQRFSDKAVYDKDSILWMNYKGLYVVDKEHAPHAIKVTDNSIFLRNLETNLYENFNRLDSKTLYWRDSLATQDWKTNYTETEVYYGYECRKATCTFRGRKWTAWYAPELPYEYGPWKLNGLPGLILCAYESEHAIAFVPIQIRTRSACPIFLPKDLQKKAISRQSALKKERTLLLHPFAIAYGTQIIWFLPNGMRVEFSVNENDPEWMQREFLHGIPRHKFYCPLEII